jgi:hypothetical protein
MTLDITSGGLKFIFSRIRESVSDSLVSSENEIEEAIDGEILLTTTSAKSELNRMKRGQSYENERGCDEIMQQFINVPESFIEPPSFSNDAEEVLQTE